MQENTFGRRLKLARQREQLSMDELSKKTGNAVSKQTISKYESGKAIAGSVILGKLAEALNVTMEYFFRPFTFDMSKIEISFRKKSTVGAKDEAALKSRIQDKIERYLELENILSLDDHTEEKNKIFPSISTVEQMKQLAISTRKSWGIGISPIENAKELLIRHGVKVFEVDGPEGFDGVCGAVNDKTWIIVLNTNIFHTERKRLTCFHEYAHLLANDSFSSELSQHDIENLCNVFASEMLLPSEVLINSLGMKSRISWQELVSIQCLYGISIDAIFYSLKRLSIINDKRYKSFYMRKNKSASFKKAAEESRFKENETEYDMADSETFKNMVYSALAQEFITPSRAAEFLQCSISDVESRNIVF